MKRAVKYSLTTAVDLGNAQRRSEGDVLAAIISARRSSFTELEFFPAHDPRQETAVYQRTHKLMVVTQDQPCWVCGVKNSTLQDPAANMDGATALETHHYHIEWALAQAISLDKFNKVMLPMLRLEHPDRQDYLQDFTKDQMLRWIDADPDNMRVLCDVHHRGAQGLGIHHATYPTWVAMRLLSDDFLAQERAVEKEQKK